MPDRWHDVRLQQSTISCCPSGKPSLAHSNPCWLQRRFLLKPTEKIVMSICSSFCWTCPSIYLQCPKKNRSSLFSQLSPPFREKVLTSKDPSHLHNPIWLWEIPSLAISPVQNNSGFKISFGASEFQVEENDNSIIKIQRRMQINSNSSGESINSSYELHSIR